MKTVAIIAEYNPFHKGHEYQINKVREAFGADTRIIAIMSGNYTQRGDVAIMDKYLRAKCALLGGVNLVLELPFPYSSSSAEFFAKCAVELINSLKVVDYLVFGSESGDIEALSDTAEKMRSEEFKAEFKRLLDTPNMSNAGYPKLTSLAYKNLYKIHDEGQLKLPNNILAIEYIKALKDIGSEITPYTIKRAGADYNEENIVKNSLQSATAIRNLIQNDLHSALDYLPESSKIDILEAYQKSEFPTDSEKLYSAVIYNFRINPPSRERRIHDADGGLYNRLRNLSYSSETIKSLICLTDTKKYTTARIRRAIWYSLFGVTSSEVKTPVAFTQLLALDSVGKSILKEIKKRTDFPIVTKPSAVKALSEEAKKQKALSDTADSLFQMTKPVFHDGNTALRQTPFVLDNAKN